MYVRQVGWKDLNRNEIRNPRATRKGLDSGDEYAALQLLDWFKKNGAP